MRSEPTSHEVISLGEALVDLVPLGTDARWQLESRAGGAPGNVATALARLGHRVALISRVGNDPMGALVLAALELAGVDRRWIQLDRHHPTTLAVVSPPGVSPGFSIYLQGSASAYIDRRALPMDAIERARILHVGTLSMSTPASRIATREAIAHARAAHVLVSLDINFRPSSWRTTSSMRAAAIELIGQADVVKLTADEMALLGEGGRQALARGPQVMLVTDAGRDARITLNGFTATRTPAAVRVVDPTGAGDAFLAQFLHRLLLETTGHADLRKLPEEFWTDTLERSLAAGTAVVARRGAGRENPTTELVLQNLRFMQTVRVNGRVKGA